MPTNAETLRDIATADNALTAEDREAHNARILDALANLPDPPDQDELIAALTAERDASILVFTALGVTRDARVVTKAARKVTIDGQLVEIIDLQEQIDNAITVTPGLIAERNAVRAVLDEEGLD